MSDPIFIFIPYSYSCPIFIEEVREKIKREVVHIAEIVQPKTVRVIVADDPDDNPILACALAGKADLIVSGDRHLLQLKEYEGIAIIRLMDFLRTRGEEF